MADQIDLTLSDDEPPAPSPKRRRVSPEPALFGGLAPAGAPGAQRSPTRIPDSDSDGDLDTFNFINNARTRPGGLPAAVPLKLEPLRGPGPGPGGAAGGLGPYGGIGAGGGGGINDGLRGGGGSGGLRGAASGDWNAGGGGDEDGLPGADTWRTGSREDSDDEDFLAGPGPGPGPGAGPGRGGGAAGRAAGGRGRRDSDQSYQLGDDEDEGAPKKKRGGKRLTAEEKAAREAERERAKREKEEAKARDKAAKEAVKANKQAEKEAAKQQKEVDNSLKASMAPRHMRLLMSNSLAAHPLGATMVQQIPIVRDNKKDETFTHEVHRNMPLAAGQFKYCMWGLRLPRAAVIRLGSVAPCTFDLSPLLPPEDCRPEDRDKALVLFPLLAVVLTGDEFLNRLRAEPSTPLAGLAGEVRGAHPSCSLFVYVLGLEEATKRRDRAEKGFRERLQDQLFDITVGMPGVRLQVDCPEGDYRRAATELLNLGWALSQQPRKRVEAYLEHFGSRSTMPMRAIKAVLEDQCRAEGDGGEEEQAGAGAAGGAGAGAEPPVRARLALADALGCLVAPQRAAAVAAEYGSLAAIMEALKRREGAARDGMLAGCRIPGAVYRPHCQLTAGPAAAAAIARFLTQQNGKADWDGGE
ncbi:hypothetical protein HYH03_002827 [Edaphochlamys debaryana]|uniref:ERCC4 domain-containing protein n=1 Tax=Edaphochlamys debaryana TaxID=47281 RepID=A0A835YAS7_9CHLO|nr:hypothetical protein HYH03_002827 [Edaphochlamys debaryana]|eukprot:KAG2499248.1 hypothetical protein HYH03_002827 [Edaphochlamys debaryana]